MRTLDPDDIVKLVDDTNDWEELVEIEYGPTWETDDENGPIERNDKSGSEYSEYTDEIYKQENKNN